jgi:cytochrome b561
MSTPYHPIARSLHWLMALFMFSLLTLGHYMSELPLSPDKLRYYSWHKWAGVTVFALAVLRLGWRMFHRPPALPDTLSLIQKLAAHAGHALLYVLMLVMPLSGWLMSSAKGVQTVWLGVVPLPDLLARDRALGDLLQNVHAALSWALVAMVLAHVLAALYHHHVLRDDTLHRMWPRRAQDATDSSSN